MSYFARVLCLVVAPMAWAGPPAVTLLAQMEASGEISVTVTSAAQMAAPTASEMAAVVHCKGRMKGDGDVPAHYRCSNALQRDGLSLEAVFDLAPIARTLGAMDQIKLWLDYPRLGFAAASAPLKAEGGQVRLVQSAEFTAGAVREPIRVQFGYRLDQLGVIYIPLAAMALALTLIAMGLCRAGYLHLQRSLFLLGTMFWLGVAASLQAADPLRILLGVTPLANFAAVLLEYCPPLLCVAAGAALGSGRRKDRPPAEIFAEIFWGYGMLLFPLTSALGAVPAMADGDWMAAAPCLVLAPVSLIVCRRKMRVPGGSSIRQLTVGELKDRVSQLAAKAGHQQVQVYVASSTRSQMLNAFAMLGKGVVLTAPLVQSLTRREVDAVVAHEVSHFGHQRRSEWAALALAAALFQTPLTGLFLAAAGGLLVAVFLPLVVFFAALRGARKREFAADAGAVALTGDARALISGLARIARTNGKTLEFNIVVEWFSTHPSTHKRIRALASAARLAPAEVEALCSVDDTGEPYALPPEDSDAVFTLAWQKSNGARYTWAALLGASGAGLLVAGLLDRFAGAAVAQLLGGIVLGCATTKILATTVMFSNYARLRQRLARKLAASGQLVGLAADSEPRVYNGFRFSDAGFLWFEGGSLCYRSERTSIGLNPADVVQVGMVAAAPSSWRRLQPMVRFRHPESGDVKAFILHPVEWGASPRRLFHSIERWRATATSAESTSLSGFAEIAGQPFHVPGLAETARGFRIPGSVTVVGIMLAGWMLRVESWPAWYALSITACAYIYMFLPALLYRPSTLSAVLAPRAGAD
jgi:heat shock protein HtpX